MPKGLRHHYRLCNGVIRLKSRRSDSAKRSRPGNTVPESPAKFQSPRHRSRPCATGGISGTPFQALKHHYNRYNADLILWESFEVNRYGAFGFLSSGTLIFRKSVKQSSKKGLSGNRFYSLIPRILLSFVHSFAVKNL